MKRMIKKIAIFLISALLLVAVWYGWNAFPIISGYGAKNLASAIFLQHRNADDVIKEDLGDFPLTLGSFKVNMEEGSVTGSVWGLAKRKAIYRKGIGCTLINDINEENLRKQPFDLPSIPNDHLDTIPWPAGDLVSDSLPNNINITQLQKAVASTFGVSFKSKPVLTRAMIVLYDGQIVAEKYATGFDKHTVMLGWSMSKSITSALIGILVKEGKLKVDAPAPVPEWKNNERAAITLEHLLQQSSGLDFKEDYSGPSDVTNMLFKKGDMAAFTAKHDLAYQPGTVFNYSSGNSNVLSRIIRHTVGEKAYPAFPTNALFHKLHMYSTILEPDASGTYIGSSYSYASARDFARFGLLYYNNGRFLNEQILPEDWVRKTTQPAAAAPQQEYGYQFWLNGIQDKKTGRRIFADVPADMFYADGYGGQYIFIIPSKKLVVVRLGLNDIDTNTMLKEVIAATGG